VASECCLISYFDARRFWCIFVLAILETNAELGVPAIPSAEDVANTTHAHRTKAESFCNTVNGVYHEIVHFMRNIFNVQSGRAGKALVHRRANILDKAV